MTAGGVVLLTATIHATEAEEIAGAMQGSGIDLIDSPVSGGRPGAQGGTLTLMASAPAALLEKWESVMQPVSGTITMSGSVPAWGKPLKRACSLLLVQSSVPLLKPRCWQRVRVLMLMHC